MVKKLLLVALVGLGGWFLYKRLQAGKEEQNLWAEATDTVSPAGTDR